MFVKLKVLVRKTKLKESKAKLLTWLICTLLCFLIQNLFATDELIGDAADYWAIGESFWKDDGFTLLNIWGFRGYVFPLFLGVCNHYIGKLGWRMANAAMVSSIFTIFVPALLKSGKRLYISDRKLDYKAVLNYAVFTILFIGLEIYPLSDLPAVFLCLFAAYEIDYIVEDIMIIKKILRGFLFGVLVYSAYNVRTIYMFAAVYLIGYLSYKLYRNRTTFINRISVLISGVVGFVVAAIPQAYLNYYEHGKFSIKVITDGLMMRQLLWGIKYQAYATYVGNEALTSPPMYFMDNVGVQILQREGITDAISLGQYVRICLKYPFEMLSIYGRHFINSILLYGPEVYIEKLDTSKILVSIISFACVFCLMLAFLLGCIRDWKTIWRFMPAIIPVICITPGAIESRFFAAMYLQVKLIK